MSQDNLSWALLAINCLSINPMDRINFPTLAVAVFLVIAFAGTLLLQSTGYYAGVSLIKVSLPIAAVLSLWTNYGYFFTLSRTHITALLIIAALLGLLGLASIPMYDLTSDGMGYQQPSAEAMLNGWNPLEKADLLWQNIYPTGVWELEAALAALYGSIEAAKMLQIWWLFIAYPVLLAGVKHYKGGTLTIPQHALVALSIFCPVVLTQLLTHYVDAMLYLAGVTFLGALLLYGESARQNRLSLLLMSACVLFIINAKLSGIYHAFVLCLCAVAFIGMSKKQLPVRESLWLLGAGLVATLFLGFHPYITNLLTYGSLLHMDSGAFTGSQRPANLTDMSSVQRFFASLFSTTGGAPRALAALKYPGQIFPFEWRHAGVPDSRTGGFGVVFSLGFVSACLLFMVSLFRQRAVDKKLLIISAILFASSLVFPESWWARYVPFAYMSVFLVLLALPKANPLALYAVIAVFSANSLIAATASYNYHQNTQADFMKLAEQLRAKPANTVYLVPPGADYMTYNHAHMPLQRRLKALGVETTVKVDAPCPNLAATLSEFAICY
jgi:hypothetical protein